MEQQVVVNGQYLVYEHSTDKVIAVRFPVFGLTAYGDSVEEAVDNFKQLFNRFIRTYREVGMLEDILGRSGVEWWPRDAYPDDRLPFEDTNPVAPPQPPVSRLLAQRSWLSVGKESTRNFAVAA
jgi:hypothetical protein